MFSICFFFVKVSYDYLPPSRANFTLTSFIASILYPNVPSRAGTKNCTAFYVKLSLTYATLYELLQNNDYKFYRLSTIATFPRSYGVAQALSHENGFHHTCHASALPLVNKDLV